MEIIVIIALVVVFLAIPATRVIAVGLFFLALLGFGGIMFAGKVNNNQRTAAQKAQAQQTFERIEGQAIVRNELRAKTVVTLVRFDQDARTTYPVENNVHLLIENRSEHMLHSVEIQITGETCKAPNDCVTFSRETMEIDKLVAPGEKLYVSKWAYYLANNHREARRLEGAMVVSSAILKVEGGRIAKKAPAVAQAPAAVVPVALVQPAPVPVQPVPAAPPVRDIANEVTKFLTETGPQYPTAWRWTSQEVRYEVKGWEITPYSPVSNTVMARVVVGDTNETAIREVVWKGTMTYCKGGECKVTTEYDTALSTTNPCFETLHREAVRVTAAGYTVRQWMAQIERVRFKARGEF